MHADSEALNVRFPNKIKLGIKEALAIFLFIGATGVTAFWLYSDRHNDERYVPQAVYEKDQKNLNDKLEKMDKTQDKILDEILKKK